MARRRPLLQGITILEWGERISAPLSGKLLAELGAEVIKVEPPKKGEPGRATPPFFHDTPGLNNSLFFEYFNAGKQSVTMDVAAASGRDLFLRLLKTADALVENIPVARKRDLQLAYDDIAKANPRIIMASLSPFGQTGPRSEMITDDLTTFAMTSSAYNNPRVMDKPGRPPLLYPGNTPAFLAGHQGATAVIMALIRRQEGGPAGASIDIAEAEIQSSLQHASLSRYEHEGIWARASGTGGTSSPYDSLPCKDGYVGIYCPQEGHWHRLLKVIGMPEVSEIELFNDGARRRQHWPEIWDMISPWFLSHGKDEIYRLCQENDVPSGAVFDIAETLKDEQFLARNAFPHVSHPAFGPIVYLRPPYDLAGESWQRHAFAPRLGRHTVQLLSKRLGISKAKLAQLKGKGII